MSATLAPAPPTHVTPAMPAPMPTVPPTSATPMPAPTHVTPAMPAPMPTVPPTSATPMPAPIYVTPAASSKPSDDSIPRIIGKRIVGALASAAARAAAARAFATKGSEAAARGASRFVGGLTSFAVEAAGAFTMMPLVIVPSESPFHPKDEEI
jgi:hypothetical protein